ncbi:MAG: purine-binding chemotaxis protein CheW [Deltaproteobacteria bacterium]|nr:purine-binding chemotaxis protein CheW [Deltaproteobacteria bacterium]
MSKAGVTQFACFEIGNQTYGADIQEIREIITNKPALPVPRAPEFMEGIINLRGQVVPIVDMRKRLGVPLPSEENSRKERIIIMKLNNREIGIIVDGVDRVISISDDNIDPSPDMSAEVGPEYLKGVAKDGKDMIMILDMNKVLTTTDQVRLDSINTAAASEQTEDNSGRNV